MNKIGKDGAPRPATDLSQEPAQTNVENDKGGGQSGVSSSTGLSADKRVVSSADAERLASQAGFVRTGGKKRGTGLDVGDSSQQPIPLPEDDVDAAAFSYEGLDIAQGQLLHHAAALGRGRRAGAKGLLAMWQAILAGGGDGQSGDDAGDAETDDEAQEQRRAQLLAMAEQAPPDAEAMAQLGHSIREHFGIDLQGEAVGPTLMATSMLVAGKQPPLQPAGTSGQSSLDGEQLFAGAQAVMDEGRQAADDARRRAEGMFKNMAMQRTFVPKR